jgi:predicted DNA-binding transcriptional regulator AlpA
MGPTTKLRFSKPSLRHCEALAGLVTHQAAAHACKVSPRMVRAWVATGAWPLPQTVGGMSFYFDLSDVDAWLKTGAWPTTSRFLSKG